MKLSTACCFLLGILAAFVGASERTSLAHNRRTMSPGNSSLTSPLENVFDLRDYGAIGDGIADDGPALQAAFDAIGNAGGGTLFVAAGRYAIDTPVQKDFTGLATEISIVGVESLTPVPPANSDGLTLTRGLDLTSEFAPRTGEQGIALSISGLQSFLIKDITFIGTPDVVNDAFITLDLHAIDSAIIRHCEFYGLSTQLGPAIVQSERSGLAIEQSAFLGTTANSGAYGSVIQNLEWKDIAISETVFVDYGQRPELFSKTGLSAPFSWVSIANAAAPTSDSPRREVVIRDVFLDEGGFNGISSLPSGYEPLSAPIDLVYISGLYMNVSNLGASGHYLSDLKNVLIENSHYGWSHNADSAVNLVGAGNAILDQLECSAEANRIRADNATGRLTVINSVYAYLDSNAAVTRVLTPATPENDPVQYVRQQFGLLAERAPDAAAHFYWSDRLLQCGEDVECVNVEHSALDAYLLTSPAPIFSISGRLTNESANPLPGVTVTLSGSQTAVAQTDADGRYVFQNLPTSGVYKVTPNHSHYTFTLPELTITTPRGDVIADFVAWGNHYAIRGSVSDAEGQGIPEVVVNLSGSETQTTVTDALGNYTFVAPVHGDYTVTPSRENYIFSPAAANITNLSENNIANFTGSLVSYTISGRATLDGVALEGVSISLSGSKSAMMTTANDGAWSFTVPAQGDYTVTAAKPNFLFSPVNMAFSSLATDQQVDFAGTWRKLMQFSASSYNTSENVRTINVTVTRTGDTSEAASVIYSAVDGSAQQRSDVIPIIGQLKFEAGETSKIFRVFITDDSYVEGDESLTLSLSDPVGGTFGGESSATLTIADNDSSATAPNAIDDARFFVRQHYRDFLNRPPDAEGLAFWSNQILACGSDAPCIENRRINVSAAFFLSIEFQETGFLVYRLYQAAYARAPEHLDEFLLDTRTIGEGVVVSNPGWQDLLAANKSSFMKVFVKRPEFEDAYPLQLTPTQFVTQLNSNAGNVLSPGEVSAAIAEFSGTMGSENTDARAAILLRVAQSQSFTQRQKNPAFVLMQYFGYLQRNPNELPDTSLDGYNFWLGKLESFGGDFYRAEMVKAFLASAEYRSRFGAH